MQACTEGRLDKVPISWNRERHAVGVVMASEGYPGEHKSGQLIVGPNGRIPANAFVFHASTTIVGGELVTDSESGRILTIVGTGSSVFRAKEVAYRALGKWNIPGATWREDISAQSK